MAMMRKKATVGKPTKKLDSSQTVERETPHKLIFPFVEIERPADVPSASDPHAIHDYFMAHPDVADRIVREYDAASTSRAGVAPVAGRSFAFAAIS
jgi:hypothetical protein